MKNENFIIIHSADDYKIHIFKSNDDCSPKSFKHMLNKPLSFAHPILILACVPGYLLTTDQYLAAQLSLSSRNISCSFSFLCLQIFFLGFHYQPSAKDSQTESPV